MPRRRKCGGGEEGEKGGEGGHCGGGDGIGAGDGAAADSGTVEGLEAAPRRFVAATTMASTAARGLGAGEAGERPHGGGSGASGYGTSADLAIIDLFCVLKRCVTAAPVDVSRGDPAYPPLSSSLEVSSRYR